MSCPCCCPRSTIVADQANHQHLFFSGDDSIGRNMDEPSVTDAAAQTSFFLLLLYKHVRTYVRNVCTQCVIPRNVRSPCVHHHHLSLRPTRSRQHHLDVSGPHQGFCDGLCGRCRLLQGVQRHGVSGKRGERASLDQV